MQEFTTTVKGLTAGLRPHGVRRNIGMLQVALNIRPDENEKLVSYTPVLPLYTTQDVDPGAPE